MRAACRAAGELASLFFFSGCAVTRQQYPESFGAECTAQYLHRPARPSRPFAVVYGGPRVVGGVPQGVADRPSYVVVGVGVEVGVGVPLSPSAFRCRPRRRRRRRRSAVALGVGVPLSPSASASASASAFRCRPRRRRRRRRSAVALALGPPRAPSAHHAGGSFGRSAPDGGRFPLKLQFSLLQRHRPQSLAVIQSPSAAATAIRTPLAHRAHPRPFRSHSRLFRGHPRPSAREGVSADPHPMEGDFR